MGDTDKRAVMRGNPAQAAAAGAMEYDPEKTPVNDLPVVAASQDPYRSPVLELPQGVTQELDGTWIYSLQYEPRPGLKEQNGKLVEVKDEVSLPFVVRIPNKVWAKNIREASRDSTNQGDLLFYLACSLTSTPPHVMDRFDARDYGVISHRCNEVLQGTAKNG